MGFMDKPRTDLEDQEHDSKMGHAIMRGATLGVPIVLILLTLGVWLMTDNDLADSFATAILPGTLLGTFGGGFAGMASAMD